MIGSLGQTADELLRRRLIAKQIARTALLYPVYGMVTCLCEQEGMAVAFECEMPVSLGRRSSREADKYVDA